MVTYTNYEVEIIMQETNNLDSMLKNRDIDIVISLNRTKSKELHSEQILSAPIKLVYSSKAKLEGDTVDQRLRSLFDYYSLYVGYLDEHVPIMEWLEREYSVKQSSNIKDSIFALRLIKENIGLGLLPEFQIATEIEEEKLKVLDIGSIASLYKVSVYMSHKRDQENLQPFLSYLRKQF